MVGSTALRTRLGEEPADELRRIHDRLLIGRIEAHGGQVLKSQGDGFMAAFPAASNGLTAAVEMQQVAASYSRRHDALAPICLRIGLSVGDVSWEEGDIFGTPVIEAARLEAAAEGGQILCSEMVRLMARGRGGHEFRPIGFLELKGLPEPVAACEVVWEPAPDEPPLPLPPELAAETAKPFVSRAAELDRVAEVIADAGRERLTVVWLLGEPGIGKTRLAMEAARRVHETGGIVLFGRCSEDVAIPYQPILEALRWHVARIADHELGDRLGTTPGELIRLAPEIGERLPGLEAAPTTSAEVELYRLFEAVRSWLAAAGAGRPLVVLLDDVHWATRPTLALLGHVIRSAEPSRTVLLCTARNTSPDDNEALAALVDELDRKGAPSQRVELEGLSAGAIGMLLELSTGQALDERSRSLVDQLHTETGGNPLFVDTLLAALPPEEVAGGVRPGALPRTVAETVARRVARLAPDVADVLKTASVVGLDFDLRVVARAAACDELDTLEALETAGRAGLVGETAADRYRFSHGLVRSALRDQLSQSRRARIHLRVGEALEGIHGSELEDQAGALAHHFSEAIPVAGAVKAYRYSVLAAERAARLLSYDEAAHHYGRALELLDDAGEADWLTRHELRLARGDVQRAAGNLSDAFATFSDAVEEATAQGAPEPLARAAVKFEETIHWLGRSGEALAVLQRAEQLLPAEESPLRAEIAAAISRAFRFRGQEADNLEWAQAAWAMAERFGDPVLSVNVLSRTSLPYVNVSDAPITAAQCAEVVSRAEEAGEDDVLIHATWQLMWATVQLGDFVAVDRLFADYTRLAELRGPLWQQIVIPFLSLRANLAGDLGAAERLLETAEEAGEARGWIREGLTAVAMFLIRREQGRLDEVAPALRVLARLRPGGEDVWQPGLAVLSAELGMMAEARSQFETFAGGNFTTVPLDASRELSLAFLAEVCVALGDAERAPLLIDLLRPCEARLLAVFGSAVCLGPTDRLLGMLATVAGQSADAERWHRAGLDLARRLPSPLWTAHCLHDYAIHLRPTGPTAGDALLAEAADLCSRHALAGLAERVDRLRA